MANAPAEQPGAVGNSHMMVASAKGAESDSQIATNGRLCEVDDEIQYPPTPNKKLHRHEWFSSRPARAVRVAVNSTLFHIISTIAVVTALFLPDIFLILQVPTNLELDLILMVVFIVFIVGFCGLLASMPSYLNSFMFWMDIVGIVAMVFDIQLMLGQDATEPTEDRPDMARDSMMFARSARASRQAARMGRLARVLKLMRMLHMRTTPAHETQSKPISQQISIQLNGLMGTRIAFLCVCLIVVLPVFNLYLYPINDDSMASWATLLSADASEVYGAPAGTLVRQLAISRLDAQVRSFRDFYSDTVSLYGPFQMCFREALDDGFNCGPDAISGIYLNPSFEEPQRKSSVFVVSADHVQLSFDLRLPILHEAWASIVGICCLIFIMGFFSLVVTTRIRILVIVPLERMLSVVRLHCTEIFKYTDAIHSGVNLNRISTTSDIELLQDHVEFASRTNEFTLLEKAVRKLGVVGSLITFKRVPEITGTMTQEDILRLNFMQEGHLIKVAEAAAAGAIPVEPTAGEGAAGPVELARPPEDIIVSLASEFFDALAVPEAHKAGTAVHCLLTSEAAQQTGWFGHDAARLRVEHFVAAAADRYLPNPFHNFSHALDVTASVRRTIEEIEANRFLSAASQLSLLVAAVAHDLGHPGVNNQFLVETSHVYALKYNDKSPLENFHCATLFQIIQAPEANVFQDVPRDAYKEARKEIVASILATDMMAHQATVMELGLLFEVNSEVLGRGLRNLEAAELLQEKGNAQLMRNATLHFCDTANPMKPWELCYKYAQLCLDEFFAQGDQEMAAGMPVQMLNDRSKVNKPNSQVGFVEFMILPFAEKMVSLFPSLSHHTNRLGQNVGHWADLWEQDSAPPPEDATMLAPEVDKFRARVQKVVDRCSQAGARRGSRASSRASSRGRKGSF